MIVLLVAVWGLWRLRFERNPDFPVWGLAEIQKTAPQVPGVEWLASNDQPVLKLTVDSANPQVAMRLAIPGVSSVDILHMKFQLTARGLVLGKEKWQDGRFMVDWRCPASGEKLRSDPVGSVRDDEHGGMQNLVVYADTDAAVPDLRLENLGVSGAFELSNLEISVVQERKIWVFGKWILAAAWLIWAVFFIRSWTANLKYRACAAAVIWLMMGLYFVIPGPWKVQRPLISEFQLGPKKEHVVAIAEPASTSATAAATGAVAALGKMPMQGGIVLKIKLLASQVRPLLHALMLFGPSLAMMCLTGRKPALWLAVFLAIAIEAAQTAFGYGFDWIDVTDLICNAIGILLALWSHAKLAKRWTWVFAG